MRVQASPPRTNCQRTHPENLGGGLPGVPAFLLANDEEIADAYADDLRLIYQVLAFANEALTLHPVGSQKWIDWAVKVDALRDAVDVHGWTGARRARMFLLAAIEGATHHEQRAALCADAVQTMRELGERTALSPGERLAVNAAMRKLGTEFPTYNDEKRFVRVTGDRPKDPVIFAVFIFRTSCPKFARGLVTAEGMAALKDAVASWPRAKGRPKKGDTRLPSGALPTRS